MTAINNTLPALADKQMGKEIIEFFNKIHPLTDDSKLSLSKNVAYLQVKKGRYLHSPLVRDEVFYFIIKGVVRRFIKENGKEITTCISDENTLVGSIRTLGLEIDTDEYLQVLEDTDLIILSRDSIDKLYEQYSEINIIGRKLLRLNYRDAEERAYLCRLPSAERRYKRFLQTHASLLGRVPLKYIASFLGMKLETLSRIRSKMV